MKLDQICFHVDIGEKFSLNGIGGALDMIAALFCHQLKNHETDGVRRVSIELIKDLSKKI